MDQSLFIVFSILIGTGTLFCLVSGIILRTRACKKSINWGLVAIFFPLGSLLFVVRFWAESKRLFYFQIAGMALIIAAYCVALNLSGAPVGRFYDRREALRKEHQEREKYDLERAMTLKTEAQDRARELYGYVQNWQIELQAKRPGPDASAAEVKAFNREYANYTGLLTEYKEAVKALSEPIPER